MSERPPRPTRADFVHWERATTRWADIDVYGHMNNARYFELIDTVVNNHLIAGCGDIRALPAIGVVAEVSCRYFAEIGYPAPVDLGVVVDRLGRSSVTYRVGLFQASDDAGADAGPADGPTENHPANAPANAEGRFVHVYVDNTDPARPVVPVPEEIRAVVERLVR